jgi:phosphonate transport system ATP-binding protein
MATLTIERCVKRFGPTVAVDDVSLTISGGEMLGIIGRSGAGKSTLLRILNRLVDPDRGTVRFGEIDVTALSGRALHRWRADCAMIFQQFNLVDRLDVLTNVLLGRLNGSPLVPSLFKAFSAADRAAAVLALDRVGVAAQAFQRADTLSGGQQQRVAIARALVQRPRIILADEPIASLDPHNARLVMDTLQRINREDGITVAVNLHDLEMARAYCDRIVGMAEGQVVFDGAPTELTPAAIERVYGGFVRPTPSGKDDHEEIKRPIVAYEHWALPKRCVSAAAPSISHREGV